MRQNQSQQEISSKALELAVLASFTSLDAKIHGTNFTNPKFFAQSALGGLALYTIYKSLLTSLKTEALRKKGLINRGVQIQIIQEVVMESLASGTTASLSIGLMLLLFPSLTLPISLLGIVGIGKASINLFDAFWCSLSELQRTELHNASRDAGINLAKLLRGYQDNYLFNI